MRRYLHHRLIAAIGCLLFVFLTACPGPPPNETPPVGGPAWESDLRPGDTIEAISDGTDYGGDLRLDVALGKGEVSTIGIGPATTEKVNTPDQSIAKAIGYLLAQQSEDGGIKSTAYGILRPGAATTALALYAMAHAPAEQIEPLRKDIDRAYAFLKVGINKHGKISAPDGTLDYPTYGTALLLVAAERLKLDMPAKERELLTQWIIDAQLTEAHEVDKDSIQYGGWDLEAIHGAKGDQLKGTNISVTSFALEALQGSMHKDAAATVERGRAWVRRCQNDDGGFVFHVWRQHPGNKAMWTDDSQEQAIAYATPTCDGIRCLMYCGADAQDRQIAAANAWLSKHPDTKFVPGFEAKAKEYGWREGLRFYYYFTQAKALSMLPEAEAKRRAAAIRKLLLAEQKSDGSFKNKQPRMFEDDPILATSLAIVALSMAGEE